MREMCPKPVRVILPGMCYRYEAITPRSEIQFEQVEGLCVGPDITMADLKGTITAFAHRPQPFSCSSSARAAFSSRRCAALTLG